MAVPTPESLRLVNASTTSSAYLFIVDDAPLQRQLGIYQVFNTSAP